MITKLTWIVRFLDGTEKRYTKASELVKDAQDKKMFKIAYSYRPNIITLTQVA